MKRTNQLFLAGLSLLAKMFFAAFLGMSIGNYVENNREILINVDEAIVSTPTQDFQIEAIIQTMDIVATLVYQESNTRIISNEYAMNLTTDAKELKVRQVEAPSSNNPNAHHDDSWGKPPRSDMIVNTS